MHTVKNLVVGSGPAGIAAVKALLDTGQSVEVIDVAYDLESVTEKNVEHLAHKEFSSWSTGEKDKLFPPPIASVGGVERRFQFGSDFPYRVPRQLSVEFQNCKTELSHGLGGFGNVWGAAILPYSQTQLRDWPISREDLDESYRNVLSYMPVSGDKDSLSSYFPQPIGGSSKLQKNAPIDYLFKKFTGIEDQLRDKGVTFGRARLAVDSGHDQHGCKYCGRCLDGCAYQSIFNPRANFKQLEKEGLVIHKGLLVLELNESSCGVNLTAIDIDTGSIEHFNAEKVFLAAGQYATTTILARSLDVIGKPIPVKDSQYFFFPFFTYRGFQSEIEFTLAEAFLELENSEVSGEPVHMQLYGRNHIIERQLDGLLPSFFPKHLVLDRLYIIQGFLSSKDSGSLELTLTSKRSDGSSIAIKGIENRRAEVVAKKVQALLRRALLKFGIVPPSNLTVVPPGRSFHTGGSFPMGGSDQLFSSDNLGRPANYERVHIVDAANFTDIAGSTIAYTIMANADRIVRSIKYT